MTFARRSPPWRRRRDGKQTAGSAPGAMARRWREHRTAMWAELGFMARHAIGYPRLVRDLIWAETVSVILTCRLFLRPQIGLAESGAFHGQREDNQRERGFHVHCDRPLLLKEAGDGAVLHVTRSGQIKFDQSLAQGLCSWKAGEGVRKGLLPGSGFVWGIRGCWPVRREHAADRNGKPFKIIELALEIHPGSCRVNNRLLGALPPGAGR